MAHEMMKPLVGKEYAVAAFLWFIFLIGLSAEMACVPYCGKFDLFLYAVCGVGFFPPSYIGARIISSLLNWYPKDPAVHKQIFDVAKSKDQPEIEPTRPVNDIGAAPKPGDRHKLRDSSLSLDAADSLVGWCRIAAGAVYSYEILGVEGSPPIRELDYLKRYSREDFVLLATIASVHLVAGSKRVSAEGRERIASKVRELDPESAADLFEDCRKFVTARHDNINPEQQFLSHGYWVLWNVLQRQPTPEEARPAGAMAHMLNDSVVTFLS